MNGLEFGVFSSWTGAYIILTLEQDMSSYSTPIKSFVRLEKIIIWLTIHEELINSLGSVEDNRKDICIDRLKS